MALGIDYNSGIPHTNGAPTHDPGTNGGKLAYDHVNRVKYKWVSGTTWEVDASGGGGGSVESVTGPGVDNTDAANPVVNARPYKVYAALIAQGTTFAPTAIVLENELGGDVVWTYSDVGRYFGTLAGAFTFQKTVTNYTILSPYINGGDSQVYALITREDIDNVIFQVYDESFTPLEAEVNGLFLEIRVYP